MARKAKRSRKIEPAVKTLEFDMDGVSPIGYIDLAQCASVVNRRFYRQGLQWAVAGMRIQTTSGQPTGGVSIHKVPETWVVGAAWDKAMNTWREQQDRALEDMGGQSLKGRYNDFKIFADTAHGSLGWGANLRPLDELSAPFNAGEWDPSQIVIPNDAGVAGNTVEYYLKMVGASSATHKSVIGGYQFGRAVPFSPDPATGPSPQTSWLNDVFDVGQDSSAVVVNAAENNDGLPYDQDEYPGGPTNGGTLELVHKEIFSTTTISRTSNIPGFVAPCGLIKITTDVPIRIFVHLVPGAHRGYLAEPMSEMN